MRQLAFVILAILAISLVRCVQGLPPGSPDARAVAAVEDAWAESRLPGPGDCLERLEVVRYDSRRKFDKTCAGVTPGLYRPESAPAACLTSTPRRGWSVNLAPGSHDDDAALEHELLHALTHCNLRRPYGDPYDAAHSDPRVWTAAGGASSVQSRARATSSTF